MSVLFLADGAELLEAIELIPDTLGLQSSNDDRKDRACGVKNKLRLLRRIFLRRRMSGVKTGNGAEGNDIYSIIRAESTTTAS
jgi:hypothetical protein